MASCFQKSNWVFSELSFLESFGSVFFFFAIFRDFPVPVVRPDPTEGTIEGQPHGSRNMWRRKPLVFRGTSWRNGFTTTERFFSSSRCVFQALECVCPSAFSSRKRQKTQGSSSKSLSLRYLKVHRRPCTSDTLQRDTNRHLGRSQSKPTWLWLMSGCFSPPPERNRVQKTLTGVGKCPILGILDITL